MEKEEVKSKGFIPLTEKMPQDYQEVIILMNNGTIAPARYCDDVSEIPAFTLHENKVIKKSHIVGWIPFNDSNSSRLTRAVELLERYNAVVSDQTQHWQLTKDITTFLQEVKDKG